MSISAAQVKAARRLLGWSQLHLSIETRLSPSTICRFEQGTGRLGERASDQIKRALEAAGIEFTHDGEPSVKLKNEQRNDDG